MKFKNDQPSQDISRLADLDRRRHLKTTVDWKRGRQFESCV